MDQPSGALTAASLLGFVSTSRSLLIFQLKVNQIRLRAFANGSFQIFTDLYPDSGLELDLAVPTWICSVGNHPS